MWGGFSIKNKNYKNFHLKSSLTNLNDKAFQKTWKFIFLLCLFQQIWTLIFVYFWPHAKSKKNLKHIYQVRDGQRDDQIDKKQTFYWNTTLQAHPINQAECFQIASSLLPAPLFFVRISKSVDTAVWTFLSFWVLVPNPRSHMYTLCYAIQYLFFYLLVGWLMTKFAPLARTQLHSPVVNHYVFIIIPSKGQW